MDPTASESPSAADSNRNTEVRRRGGVGTRGGRLPPIRMRDCASITTPAKKVIAPKIPQRRIKVKEETQECHEVFSERDNRQHAVDSSQKNSRGRGRGAKVYVQSDGTFLGEGPAMKMKKEVQSFSYEKGQRGSSKGKGGETKFDPSSLKYLFEDYDEDEVFDEHFLLPIRYPLLKQDIKKEVKQEIKTEIMKENLEEDLVSDFKLVIKKEPEDELPEMVKTEETEVVKQLEKVDISDKGERHFIGENCFVLLQFPSILPFSKSNEKKDESQDSSSTAKSVNLAKQSNEIKETNTQTGLKSLNEGRIGKLQILRSGEMRLVTRSMTMSLESTMDIPNVCEVVSVPIGNNREDMIKLGRIDKKFILRPAFPKEMMKAHSKVD